ncbi:GNAT family N-acetyltransferase [Actinophytocola sp.]|uniref:GNAT family N-acetyltransferase n=1 Tax=Actinophytocola sp. TaxID=1872138 RepID=UPI002D80F328|nr:GNAT family N-acetyltransferase [Actinophytocola sp.]HET9140354.1 GNAT family N-acetyltransferase [Actinophytocola sp.]
MKVRIHDDPAEYWALARPVFAADPLRHTHGLSVGRRLVETPAPDLEPPVLMTLWDGDRIAGAAFRQWPWPFGISAVPAGAGGEAFANALLEHGVDLPCVSGPRDTAEPFGQLWSTLTGASVREVRAMRLFRLGTLEPPATAGRARAVTEDDLPMLVEWVAAFEVEAIGERRSTGQVLNMLRQSLALGNGLLLWEDGDQAVSYAAVGAPVDGMSRIGPVYTPPELRGRGYGAAITAEVSRWALEAGAEYVCLFTDLANPVSNAIYQRIGYRPVYDQTELAFEN